MSEDLIKAIAYCSGLEAPLKVREDELELNKGVMAENEELQVSLANLISKIDRKEAKVVDLNGELSVNNDGLAHAERDRAIAISEAAAPEDALCVCRLERDKEVEAYALKVVKFEGRIKDMEVKLSVLNEHVSALKAEDVATKVATFCISCFR